MKFFKKNIENNYLIIGLGNPGKEYEKNRHNIGYMCIKYLKNLLNIDNIKIKYNNTIYEYKKNNKTKIILAKSHEYMNNSGDSIRNIVKFFKIINKKIIVIHDDIDLDFGIIKYKIGGGNAGHNGLKSIDNAIGNEYYRIRIGVGRPERKEMVSGYVLSNFKNEEILQFDDIFKKTHELINEIISL